MVSTTRRTCGTLICVPSSGFSNSVGLAECPPAGTGCSCDAPGRTIVASRQTSRRTTRWYSTQTTPTTASTKPSTTAQPSICLSLTPRTITVRGGIIGSGNTLAGVLRDKERAERTPLADALRRQPPSTPCATMSRPTGCVYTVSVYISTA